MRLLLTLVLILFSLVGTINGDLILPSDDHNIPVVYIFTGKRLPPYVMLSIELASRHNHVYILCEEAPHHMNMLPNATFKDINSYWNSAEKFVPLYKHKSLDKSVARKRYELSCIQRWFVLREFMERNKIERLFYGDGDTILFMSAAELFSLRSNCDAVISIEAQRMVSHRCASGHSSLWTLDALKDFTDFTVAMYRSFVHTLHTGVKGVSDMSVLWFWWVAHWDAPGWGVGRPWRSLAMWLRHTGDVATLRNLSDYTFIASKHLPMPNVTQPLRICNGLDVVKRTVMDHMHGWSEMSNFSFNYSIGHPVAIGASLPRGGAPENVDPMIAIQYDSMPLHFATIHYQGNAKDLLIYDVCRFLSFSGSKSVLNRNNKVLCNMALRKHKGGACREHSVTGSVKSICV